MSRSMTTIAANRFEMAADTMIIGATKTAGRKLWQIRGWVIGGADGYSDVIKVIAEMKTRRDMNPKQVLEQVDVKAKDAELLLLSPNGKLYHSEGADDPIEILEPWAAIGTGAQGAVVAMRLGLSPRQAVKEMVSVDCNTGGRIHNYKI